MAAAPLGAADEPRILEGAPTGDPLTPQQLRGVLPYLSNPAVRSDLARSLGLRAVAGRPLDPKGDDPSSADEIGASRVDQASDFDRMVSGDATSVAGQQRNPSVAVNPLDQSIVVVVAENTKSITGNSRDCSIYVSDDGGASYSYASDAPLFSAAPHTCASPRVLFSPDGKYLYVAYLDRHGAATDVVALRYPGFNPAAGSAGGFFAPGTNDSPSLGVHTFDSLGAGRDAVYLTYVSFSAGACSVQFQSFSNYLGAAGPVQVLATSPSCTGGAPLSNRVLQGPTVAGGPETQVLACWFDSGTDGYSTPVQITPPVPPTPVAPLNKFNIACRSSNNRGATFAGNVTPPESVTPPDYSRWIYAAKNVVAELPYFLGPNGLYFSIGASNYPSLAIDHLGNAHIVFSFNPAPTNRFTSESANVGYIKSVNAVPTALVPTVYSKWSAKSVVASGFGGQLFPTVTAQHVHESLKPYIYVGWLDTAASAPLGAANANIIYDARYKVSKTGGPAFGAAIVSSDHASTTDQTSVGSYVGSTAGPGIFHFAWTDNRFSISNLSSKEHIFTDRN
jgi:hypothetical protein